MWHVGVACGAPPTLSFRKQCIELEQQFDFLKDLVAAVPDMQGEGEEPHGEGERGPRRWARCRGVSPPKFWGPPLTPWGPNVGATGIREGVIPWMSASLGNEGGLWVGGVPSSNTWVCPPQQVGF